MVVENLFIRLAVSRWGKWQHWYSCGQLWGWSQPKSRCRMQLKNINRNPFKQSAFQDYEDSKVTTNLQKGRQEKNETNANGKKNKASQTAPPERVPFFGRLLQTDASFESAWTSMGEFWECGVSASRKKTEGSEAVSQRRTFNRQPRWKVRCCATSSRRISRRIICYIYTVWILPKHWFTVDKGEYRIDFHKIE